MCEACRFTEHGDIPENREEFLYHYAGDISGNAVYLIGMICNFPQGSIDFNVDVGGHTLIEKTVNINYCPICGRDLRRSK